MSSIMRARNALPGRGEEAEVIGGPLRAEGCWTFNARDQMPRSSPLTAHPLTATAKNAPASTPPSRESGFVPCRLGAFWWCRHGVAVDRAHGSGLAEEGPLAAELVRLRPGGQPRLEPAIRYYRKRIG